MARKQPAPHKRDTSTPEPPVGLRIIGGQWRGRKLRYGGDPRVRPMKDRVREAVFNLLGPGVKGKHALDLFAGTGALGLEALSRGAARATFIERHHPTAQVLRENIRTVGAEAIAEVIVTNAFLTNQWQRAVGDIPWVVFVSPPYDFYVDRAEEMLKLVGGLMESAPAASLFVVESDERFDFGLLPAPGDWDVRVYPPAVVGLREIPSSKGP
jgi:16S rRNA (guanine966-N2)-methyltransferase